MLHQNDCQHQTTHTTHFMHYCTQKTSFHVASIPITYYSFIHLLIR